jgi:hypothetical protein
LEQIAIEASYVKELATKYGIPETAIRLVTNSLPSTPAAAAAAGENVATAAAQAQVDSTAETNAGVASDGGESETSSALSANFAESSYVPNDAMVANAKRALDVRAKASPSNRGMTDVGLARARDIINKRALSEDTVRRMKAYFDRHEVDKQGETWDEQGKGWQAWNGWGGDAGQTWANAIVERLNSTRQNSSARERIALALAGPSARKLARNEVIVRKQVRISAMRKRLGNSNASPEMTRHTFERMGVAKK